MKYPIYEHFYAFQGEGNHMGIAAYFIRLYGCPLQCPWCDSAGTWHKDYVPEQISKLNENEIGELLQNHKFKFVVITGGEPAIFDLFAITGLKGIRFHLETSGAFKIKGNFDWITVSPKWDKMPLPENILLANELKIIVEDENSIQKWIDAIPEILNNQNIWLHPEWSQKNNPKVLNSISSWVKESEYNFRAGYQLHKLYKVDNLDTNSKPLTPLGGKIENGY